MWYNISCADRLLRWRDWRHSLDDLSYDQALIEVSKTWMMVPRVNHYLTPDEIESWPTPWELINDNMYCDLAVALGMLYSLQLSKHSQEHKFSLAIIKHDSNWMNLCLADGWLSVLNWQEGFVVNTPTLPVTAIVQYHYNKVDLARQLG